MSVLIQVHCQISDVHRTRYTPGQLLLSSKYVQRQSIVVRRVELSGGELRAGHGRYPRIRSKVRIELPSTEKLNGTCLGLLPTSKFVCSGRTDAYELAPNWWSKAYLVTFGEIM